MAKLWLFCAGFLICWVGSVSAGSIRGSVRAQGSGAPLAGANIEVTGSEIEGRTGATAGLDGHYEVLNLPAGRYVVKVTFVGYVSHTAKDVQVFAGDSATELNVDLRAGTLLGDEIVVSASLRPENILDAPVSVTRIEGDSHRENATTSSHLSALEHVKGVRYVQVNLFREHYNARGNNSVITRRTLVLTDGRVTRAGGGGPIFGPTLTKDDLQDVEVIVGPGSALYGPDAISGVISVRSRDPRESAGTSITLSGGNRSVRKIRFGHAGLSGKWGWKVSGDHQTGHSFELSTTYDNPDTTSAIASVTDGLDFDARYSTGGIGLYYYPSVASRLSLTAGISSIKEIEYNPRGTGQPLNYINHYQQLTYRDARTYVTVYHTGDDPVNYIRIGQKVGLLLQGVPEDEAKARARVPSEATWSFWEAEARRNFSLPNLRINEATIGINLRFDRQVAPGATTLSDKLKQNLAGIYGLVSSELNDAWRLVLAGRVDWHDVYSLQISPKASLIHRLNDAATIRFSFNRAYESPSIIQQNILVQTGPTPAVMLRHSADGFQFGTRDGSPLPAAYANGLDPLTAESNNTYEVGLKAVVGARTFVDVTAYLSRYKNFISDPIPVGDPAAGVVTLDEAGNPRNEVTLSFVNFGKQNVRGLDAEVRFHATESTEVWANASFIDSEELILPTGAAYPFNTPTGSYNAGIQIRDIGIPGTSVSLTGKHVAEHEFLSGIRSGTVPAYTLFNLNLGYQTARGVTYRASVKNLLDNDHIEIPNTPILGRIVIGEIQYAF